MKLKVILMILACSFLASCAGIQKDAYKDRAPAVASPKTCNELARSLFLSDNYEKDLKKILKEKNLLTWTEKLVQLKYPRLEWINKAKKALNQSIRNWNNNRYPAFYIFNDEEIIPLAKRYAENLEKISADQVPVDDIETTKAFVSVSEWVKAYKNYKTDLDQLLEERISLQYNISLLKKLKLDNDPRDIQLTIKRAGELKNEILTLRKEDKNLQFIVKRLQKEMLDLDWALIKNGKIKDRIIRQAVLQDILTIVQREMEYASKNGFDSPALSNEMAALGKVLKKSDFIPSTYGVYKAQNKIAIRELLAASKLDVLYSKFNDPAGKVKSLAAKFLEKAKNGLQVFKRLYVKVTSITPKQAAIGGGTVAVAGLGAERYFWFKETSSEELKGHTTAEEIGPDDQAHLEQLENTEKVDLEKHAGHSQVIEVQIDELTGEIIE